MQLPDDPITWLSIGGASAFVSALLRCRKRRMKWIETLIESFTCSMLSTSIVIFVHVYFGASPMYALPIGTFVGSFGSSTLKSLIVNWLKARGFIQKSTKKESTKDSTN